MLEAERMILESTVKVRHGWMTRVAGFGEQAQVREQQFPDQSGAFTKFGVCRRLPMVAMEQHQDTYNPVECRK